MRGAVERVPEEHQEGPFAGGLSGDDQHTDHARAVSGGAGAGGCSVQ